MTSSGTTGMGWICPSCNILIPKGEHHDCLTELRDAKKRIAELEAQLAELRKHHVVMRHSEKRPDLVFPPEYYEPSPEEKVLQDELALAQKRIIELTADNALLHAALAEALANYTNLRHKLTQTEGALMLAAKDILDDSHKTYDAFDMRPLYLVLADDVVADYMERAQP